MDFVKLPKCTSTRSTPRHASKAFSRTTAFVCTDTVAETRCGDRKTRDIARCLACWVRTDAETTPNDHSTHVCPIRRIVVSIAEWQIQLFKSGCNHWPGAVTCKETSDHEHCWRNSFGPFFWAARKNHYGLV